ncbi:MAG: hypothetical protein JF602_07235 [Gemmatimonadetes bacterium]|nr:hypothetical protein [Gemmatimonadota bacterium]
MTPDLRDQLERGLAGSYTLERELGAGGMSRVFVADDTSLRRKVVVKVLRTDIGESLSADRFKREIQLAARLQHPHIVPLLAAGALANGALYYTMPFVDGERAARCASRHQAGEHPPLARQRGRGGFRHRKSDSRRARRWRRRDASVDDAHRGRHVVRHAGVHVARTGGGRQGGSPRRPVRPRRRRVRDDRRPSAFRRADGAAVAGRACVDGAGRDRAPAGEHTAVARCSRHAAAGEEPGGSPAIQASLRADVSGEGRS